MGAALATTAAYALWFLMVRIAAHRFQCPRFPWPTLARVAVSLTICAFVMHYVANQVPGPALVRMLTGILAGVLVYGLALVSARELSVDEIRSILARRSRPMR
jgi:flagellar biosynthesis protein FliR